MNILGIDYGERKIGLAIAYKEYDRFIVVKYKTLENIDASEVIKEINNITDREEIKKIVVGLPLGLKGIKTEQTLETEKFIDTLKLAVNAPVLKEDERLTSAMAKKISDRDVHEEAAKIILEGYVEKLGKNG